jgi:hypothetical protein
MDFYQLGDSNVWDLQIGANSNSADNTDMLVDIQGDGNTFDVGIAHSAAAESTNFDLDILGSVSGGCIEGSVISEAQEIMKTGIPKLLRFGVSNSDAWEVGLTCGGKVEVFLEKIGDSD